MVAALDLYVEQGQWDKCIETATKQVLLFLPSPAILDIFPCLYLAQGCISLTSSKAQPQKSLTSIKESVFHTLETGVRGLAGPGLHMPWPPKQIHSFKSPPHPHCLVLLIPTSPCFSSIPGTELQDSAQVCGFVCDSPDPRGWLWPGTSPVCAARSPC